MPITSRKQVENLWESTPGDYSKKAMDMLHAYVDEYNSSYSHIYSWISLPKAYSSVEKVQTFLNTYPNGCPSLETTLAYLKDIMHDGTTYYVNFNNIEPSSQRQKRRDYHDEEAFDARREAAQKKLRKWLKSKKRPEYEIRMLCSSDITNRDHSLNSYTYSLLTQRNQYVEGEIHWYEFRTHIQKLYPDIPNDFLQHKWIPILNALFFKADKNSPYSNIISPTFSSILASRHYIHGHINIDDKLNLILEVIADKTQINYYALNHQALLKRIQAWRGEFQAIDSSFMWIKKGDLSKENSDKYTTSQQCYIRDNNAKFDTIELVNYTSKDQPEQNDLMYIRVCTYDDNAYTQLQAAVTSHSFPIPLDWHDRYIHKYSIRSGCLAYQAGTWCQDPKTEFDILCFYLNKTPEWLDSGLQSNNDIERVKTIGSPLINGGKKEYILLFNRQTVESLLKPLLEELLIIDSSLKPVIQDITSTLNTALPAKLLQSEQEKIHRVLNMQKSGDYISAWELVEFYQQQINQAETSSIYNLKDLTDWLKEVLMGIEKSSQYYTDAQHKLVMLIENSIDSTKITRKNRKQQFRHAISSQNQESIDRIYKLLLGSEVSELNNVGLNIETLLILADIINEQRKTNTPRTANYQKNFLFKGDYKSDNDESTHNPILVDTSGSFQVN